MNQIQILEKLNSIEEQIKVNPDTPLSFSEACKYLHLRPSYLYKLTSQKKIRFYKPNGKILYFNKRDLDSWIFGHYGSTELNINEKNKNKKRGNNE